MGWWLLLLFSFQTHAGALYGWLGALTATFMLGLAVGAALAPRAAFADGERTEASLPGAVRALRLCLGAAVLFAATLPWTLPAAARREARSWRSCPRRAAARCGRRPGALPDRGRGPAAAGDGPGGCRARGGRPRVCRGGL
jgi:hypothetical protein